MDLKVRRAADTQNRLHHRTICSPSMHILSCADTHIDVSLMHAAGVNRSKETDMSVELLAAANGRFGTYLASVMERNGIDARILSTSTGISYEHLRKLIKGLSLPSDQCIEQISTALKGFNAKEATMHVLEESAQRTFKYDFHRIVGIPEDADELLKSWRYLTADHKATIITMVRAFEKTDRSRKRK